MISSGWSNLLSLVGLIPQVSPSRFGSLVPGRGCRWLCRVGSPWVLHCIGCAKTGWHVNLWEKRVGNRRIGIKRSKGRHETCSHAFEENSTTEEGTTAHFKYHDTVCTNLMLGSMVCRRDEQKQAWSATSSIFRFKNSAHHLDFLLDKNPDPNNRSIGKTMSTVLQVKPWSPKQMPATACQSSHFWLWRPGRATSSLNCLPPRQFDRIHSNTYMSMGETGLNGWSHVRRPRLVPTGYLQDI